MFYKTTVHSLVPGGVVDSRGKTLTFIGNKVARVGDTIWTDGRVVFGHTPVRGSPILAGGGIRGTVESPLHSGYCVPVFLAGGTQGYFDNKGNFHEAELPVSSSYFVNDDKCYYELPEELDKRYVEDVEIAVNEQGETEGYRYAYRPWTNGYKTTTFLYEKGGEIIGSYNYRGTYPFRTGNYAYDGSSLGDFVLLDKDGSWRRIVQAVKRAQNDVYTFEEYGWYGSVWGWWIQQQHKWYVSDLQKNDELESHIYENYGATTHFHGPGGLDQEQQNLKDTMMLAACVSYSPIVLSDGILPLQDGFKIKYPEKLRTEYYSYYYGGLEAEKGQRLVMKNGDVVGFFISFPFYTNKFEVLNESDNAVVEVDFPAETISPKPVRIAKLSGELYLLSVPTYSKEENAQKYNGMYLYDRQNGLRRVLDKCCLNYRLRPMRNVLNAKVIT